MPKLAVFLVILAAPAAALAQPSTVVVFSTAGDGSAGDGLAVANTLVRLARAGSGRVLTASEARSRFERAHSSPPSAPEAAVYEQLRECADELAIEVAARRFGHAQEIGRRCRALAASSLELLNRRADAAGQILDACLYIVRALLNTASRQEARAEMLRCRATVPDLAPVPTDHTEDVLALLDEVDGELRRTRTALVVESRRPGCRVYINGRRLGSTPFRRSGMPPARYRVQVECGEAAGRVYAVDLVTGTVRLEIDEGFDGVVRSEGGLHLRYASPAHHEQRRREDALTVGEAVGAETVWLVSPVDGEHVYRVDQLRRGDGGCGANTSVLVSASDDGTELRFDAGATAIERLREGRSANLATARELRMEPWRSAACASRSTPDAGPRTEPHWALNLTIAGGLVALGGGLSVPALYTLATRGDCVETAGPHCLSRVSFGPLSATFLAVAGAALVIGIVVAVVEPFTVTVGGSSSTVALTLTGRL